jgi:UDP-N-acetylmuramate dehydrogenase
LKGIEIVGANYISPDIEIPEIEGRYGNLPVQANYISPDIEIPEIEGRYGNLPVRYIKVGSGEIWDDFVYFSVNKGLGGGIENLVKIPGKVGSGIVQNIGAYGVEIKDLLVSVEAYDFENNKIVNLKKEELEFEYRNSFFKKRNGKYFIISAIFKLENKPKSFILDYGNIKNNIDKHTELTPLIIANTISKIRESKLPDYKVLGNCGSFFKNPIINYNLFNLLKSKYKNIPSYKIDEDFVKIPAAWLIETSGFKGYQFGGAKVYENHSLIIVNENNATPKDIKTLSDLIINKVFDDFSIKLEPEVIFVN